MVRFVADDRPGGDNIVKRSQAEAAFRQQMDAEVLRVSVDCRQHPEEQLSLEKRRQIGVTRIRRGEDARNLDEARTTLPDYLRYEYCSFIRSTSIRRFIAL